MVILLDTHAILFAVDDHFENLRAPALSALEASTRVLVSTISFYEIGQKIRIGKLNFDSIKLKALPDLLKQQGADIIPVSGEIMIEAALLDWTHRDPFDRMIVATALSQDAKIITRDRKITEFVPQQVVW